MRFVPFVSSAFTTHLTALLLFLQTELDEVIATRFAQALLYNNL